ncbi:MAG: ABC transporter substrate-binding protein, partial [Eubacterium sp.]|nr:ABC transporter substrate-binding protein [Eubacterium sp.]
MNKIIKKITAVALSAVLVGGCLAGCSSQEADQPDEKKTSFKIGICQLMQHDALDAATKGFQDKLNELAAVNGVTIEYDVQNASGDSAACATIANQFVSNKYDLIMANATPALQACATATAASKTPVIATSVTDFGVALGIDMAPTDPTGIN